MGKDKSKTNMRQPKVFMRKLTEDVNLHLMQICGQHVLCAVVNNRLYFPCQQILQMSGISCKRGFVTIDNCLAKGFSEGQPAFLLKGRTREWILKQALLEILRSDKFYKKKTKQIVEDAILKTRLPVRKETINTSTAVKGCETNKKRKSRRSDF